MLSNKWIFSRRVFSFLPLSRIITLNGPRVHGISSVDEKKVYVGKNLSKSQVLSTEWKTKGVREDKSVESGTIQKCHDLLGVQLSAQPSTPVPRRPLPVCLQCRLQTTSSLCQPRSSHRASPSSQQLWSVGFFCGRPCDMKLVNSLRDPAISRDSFKRSLKTFLFSAYSCT